MPNKTVEQLKQLWGRMNPRQRMVIAGGTAATLLAMALLVKTMGSPDYKPLMTGLEPDDAQALSQQLAAKKIDYKLSPDGKGIDVAADQLDQARLEVASQGSTHSGRMGFELFDKASWGQTEFDEKVNYQRALEGELERTIGTLRGVKSARVHLVMSRDSVFLDRERAAKASVTLRLKRGSLTQEQLDSIARLVSGAVEDLAPADVAIIDADSDQPLNRHGATAQGRELEDEFTKRLVATLGPAVGAENLRASVNVEYDLTSSEESQDKYDPAVSALLTTQKTQETGTASADGGVAGTAANLPAGPGQPDPQALAPADGSTQTSSSENSTFGVNKIARHTISPAGRIRRITAAILVNDFSDRKLVGGKLVGSTYHRSPAQLKQLETLASAVLGADPQRGDVISVENMSFNDPSEAEMPPTLAERLQKGVNDFAVPLRYASMLLLFVLAWALLFRPMQKQFAASLRELGAGTAAPPLALAETRSNPELPAEALDQLLEADTHTVNLKRRLTEMVQAEPVTMTRTVQAWLQESEG